MMQSLHRLLAVVSLSLFISAAPAQPVPNSFDIPVKNESKPFRVLTSGKQVTIKSSKEIKSIMVWTATGHRIVEQTKVNASSFTFNVSGSREKVFFIMVQYAEGKPVTEKIGVQ